jgi:hypothetical protein
MAAGVAAAGLAEARPIALKRRHSDNVYAAQADLVHGRLTDRIFAIDYCE